MDRIGYLLSCCRTPAAPKPNFGHRPGPDYKRQRCTTTRAFEIYTDSNGKVGVGLEIKGSRIIATSVLFTKTMLSLPLQYCTTAVLRIFKIHSDDLGALPFGLLEYGQSSREHAEWRYQELS